jgi:hypothetical protein
MWRKIWGATVTQPIDEAVGKVSLSNAGSTPLDIWIEPWCDELGLPPRSCVSFETVPFEIGMPLPELEIEDGRLVVWASTSGNLVVAIDGVEQDTGSRSIVLPGEMFEMPMKEFVSMVFGGFPETRPGGIAAPIKRPLWKRILGL